MREQVESGLRLLDLPLSCNAVDDECDPKDYCMQNFKQHTLHEPFLRVYARRSVGEKCCQSMCYAWLRLSLKPLGTKNMTLIIRIEVQHEETNLEIIYLAAGGLSGLCSARISCCSLRSSVIVSAGGNIDLCLKYAEQKPHDTELMAEFQWWQLP